MLYPDPSVVAMSTVVLNSPLRFGGDVNYFPPTQPWISFSSALIQYYFTM